MMVKEHMMRENDGTESDIKEECLMSVMSGDREERVWQGIGVEDVVYMCMTSVS